MVWKSSAVLFLTAIPLFAHTTQALDTGRYPLKSGLRTLDSNLI